MVPHADERVVRVYEKAAEEVGDSVGVDELEDEATAPDAQLESGRLRVLAGAKGRAPLDAESDDEAVAVVAAEVESGSEPYPDDFGRGRDGGGHWRSVEVDGEHAVVWR